jgi:hypothetical protein
LAQSRVLENIGQDIDHLRRNTAQTSTLLRGSPKRFKNF